MSQDTNINLDDVLKAMREQIGSQAQEIAVLKATIAALTKDQEAKS